MKTNFFEKSIDSKAGTKNPRGAPAFLKKRFFPRPRAANMGLKANNLVTNERK